ncbi:MAG: DUF1080 domain-containing protein, partial [Deltaproteobacteria bacterium]|nr:DUF1080 domain-containing protein [Deltaproteobacteria bacterium]
EEGAQGEQGREAQGEQEEPGQEEGEAAEAEPGEEAPQREGQEEKKEEEGEKAEGETVELFAGNAESMQAWKKVGAGELELRDQELQLRPGRERGLAYYRGRRFDDFKLKLQYRLEGSDPPPSAAIRFLDPEQPVPDRKDPSRKETYDNQAFVAAHTGFEVLMGSGPTGKAGTFAGVPVGDEAGKQRQPQEAELRSGDWNELEIEARGSDYAVHLNGVETARFTNSDAERGKPANAAPEAGYVGVLMGQGPRPGRQPGPGGRPLPGLPRPLAGPMLPGRAGSKRPARTGGGGAPAQGREAAPQAQVAIRRIEVQVLGATAQPSAEAKKGARRDLAAIHEESLAALARLKGKDQGLQGTLNKAYGYAVLPAVGRASLLLGGARGYGEVFEQHKPIGFTRVTQLTFGVQVGGQTFTQLILFGSKESLEMFKRSPLAFNANLSAVFIRGASGMTDFKDVTAHAYSRGGMLLEASLGGQKYRFMREDEALQALAKSHEHKGARAKVAQAGRAAKGLGGKLASKVGGLLHREHKEDKGHKEAE